MKVLATSVIRGAQLRDSQGGLYLVDLDSGESKRLIDWNRTDIDIAGRGGDRGLRGIAVYRDRIFVASSRALIVFDHAFRRVAEITHPWLMHCHELSLAGDLLSVVSTAFDAILTFDIARNRFVEGLLLRAEGNRVRIATFAPDAQRPERRNDFHLNMATRTDAGLYVAGRKLPALLYVHNGHATVAAPLPRGTHNAQPFAGGVIFNDTAQNRLCVEIDGERTSIALNRCLVEPIEGSDYIDSELARPLFARGLCLLDDGTVIGGTSPSALLVYSLPGAAISKVIKLSSDVRNAIHGIAQWPVTPPLSP